MASFSGSLLLTTACAGPCSGSTAQPAERGDGATDGSPAANAPARPWRRDPLVSLSPASAFEAETYLQAAGNGFVAVTWTAVPKHGPPFIGCAFSTDDGATFLPAAAIHAPAGRSSSDPALVADAQSNLHLAWVGFRPGGAVPFDAHVYVATARAGQTAFGPPVEVSNPLAGPFTYDKPWITVTARGTLLVTFQRSGDDGHALVAARSDDGRRWSRSLVAFDPTRTNARNLARPCASPVADDDRVWVTYLDQLPGGAHAVGVSWSLNDGDTWVDPHDTPRVSLPGEAVEFGDPTCATDGRDLWVSYGLSDDPRDEGAAMQKLGRTRVAHLADFGMSIDKRFDVQDPKAGRFALNPVLARDADGGLGLLYYAGDRDQDPDGSVRWAHAPDAGLHFGPSAALGSPLLFVQSRTDPRGFGDYAGLVTRAGSFYASYVDSSSGASHIAFHKGRLP